jgi:hypothetical protein
MRNPQTEVPKPNIYPEAHESNEILTMAQDRGQPHRPTKD